MGRIRTIKPEFPQSETMGRVSRDARLLFILLWTVADDSGRARANSRMLASLLYPYDDDAKGLIPAWLDELDVVGAIRQYIVDDNSYLEICNWLKHQKIDRPSKPMFPEFVEGSAKPREGSSGDQGPRTKDQGRDQGRDQGDMAQQAAPSLDERIAELRLEYPKRSGGQRWGDARKALNARLREGTSWEEILAGVRRYADWVSATGIERTERVQQVATFLGTNRGFDELWTLPPKPETQLERIKRLNGAGPVLSPAWRKVASDLQLAPESTFALFCEQWKNRKAPPPGGWDLTWASHCELEAARLLSFRRPALALLQS